MKIVYLDDQKDETIINMIKRSAAILCDSHLNDTIKNNIEFEWIGPVYGTKEAFYLEEDGRPVRTREHITGIPAADDIKRLKEDPFVLFLIDVQWAHINNYGLRLAKYLSKQGIDQRRLHLFTNWGDSVRDLERKQENLPWLHCFRKDHLKGELGAERIADTLYKSALFTLANSPSPENDTGQFIQPSASSEQSHTLLQGYGSIVGFSKEMNDVYRLIEKVANEDVSVLINGETGTGKELIAKAIHENSLRSSEELITLSVSELTETLIESELFGHEKGAFTGASEMKKGYLERADGGTLFLDELGEIPFKIQHKLLRVIQEREVTRVGGKDKIEINVRIISATHKDLDNHIKTGLFREDLYHRLAEYPITLPALRDRGSDTVILALHFLNNSNQKRNKNIKGFTEDAIRALLTNSWKGNIRQLQNTINRAAINCEIDIINEDNLMLKSNDSIDLDEDQVQIRLNAAVLEILYLNNGDVSLTSIQLGLTEDYIKHLNQTKQHPPKANIKKRAKRNKSVIDKNVTSETFQTPIPNNTGFYIPDFRQWNAVKKWLIDTHRLNEDGKNYIEERVCLRAILNEAIREDDSGRNISAIKAIIIALKEFGSLLLASKKGPEKRFWRTIARLLIHICDHGNKFFEKNNIKTPDILLRQDSETFPSFIKGLNDSITDIKEMIDKLLIEQLY